jgi:hypothetical protein
MPCNWIILNEALINRARQTITLRVKAKNPGDCCVAVA